MASNADYCRRKAEECEAVADTVTSLSARRDLIKLADAWRTMADRLNRQPLPPAGQSQEA